MSQAQTSGDREFRQQCFAGTNLADATETVQAVAIDVAQGKFNLGRTQAASMGLADNLKSKSVQVSLSLGLRNSKWSGGVGLDTIMDLASGCGL